jgi:hypothetical protein
MAQSLFKLGGRISWWPPIFQRCGQLKPPVSLEVMFGFRWTTNSIRQLQPFGRHFALNGASFLILDYGHHFQAMRRETRVFFVFFVFWVGHNFLPATPAEATLQALTAWI